MFRSKLMPFFAVAFMTLSIGFMSFAAADSGRGRHRQLYVVPAPGEVAIDGHLTDWDLSAQIEVFVQEATRSTQSVGFAMMYDEDALYISGEVNDPNPMRNRHDPDVMPHRAWDADACQVRIVVDADSEYPVQESAFTYRGADAPEDTRDDIVHLLLWHYTDDGTPYLQMHQGMGYRSPEGWEPHGLVPQNQFDAAYRKSDDGRRYTFEYRVPWETLRADNPPSAGDVVAGTMQMHWARPDGLSIGSGRNVARDIIGRSGVPFQSAAVWGRMIFTDDGDVPEELVLEGVPQERPLPLEFSYELPEDVETTIQLMDDEGIVHRILVAQQERPAGRNIERWDGMDNHFLVDDHGDFISAGQYNWTGVYNTESLRAQYRFSVHNSGNPPYRTHDGTGGWGGDHGVPRDVVALDDGLLFCWEASEAGFGLIRTDMDGQKLWGSNQDAMHLAADDDSIYIAGGRGFVRHEGVRRLHLSDARPRTFADGGNLLYPPEGEEGADSRVTGLAVSGGMLYVSFAARDLIAVYNLSDSALSRRIDIESPGRMAVLPDGRLAAVSAGEVALIDDSEAVSRFTSNVEDASGLAVCGEGNLYVANRGELQNVSVFSPNGEFVRSIGREGGRPAMGTYDPTGMYRAGGIDIDPQGRLWVAESSDFPKRISLWDADSGENLDEFFGASGYFAHGYIDPDRPDEIYAHNVIWSIDWDSYSVEPKFTLWRKTNKNMAPHPSVSGYGGVLRMITAENGRQFAWGGAPHQAVFVYMRDGDVFRPIVGEFAPWRGSRFDHGIPAVDDKKAEMEEERGRIRGNLQYLFWQDRTDDGMVNAGEFSLREGEAEDLGTIMHMDKDLSLWLSCGRKLPPREITDDGRPVYDLADAEETPLTGKVTLGEGGRSWTTFDDEGAVYTMSVTSLGNSGAGLTRWTPEGELDWRIPDLIRWRDGRTLPTAGPGRLWGATQLMGAAGDYLVGQNYFGASHIYRTDGMYVGAVLGGGPSGRYDPSLTDSRYDGQSEGQGGSFVKLNIDGEDRYFMIHGSHDVRVWEIMGLDTLQNIEGGHYVHEEDDVKTAQAAFEEFQDQMAGVQEIRLLRGLDALEEAEPVSRRVEGGRQFEARLAYDDENLYVKYEVEAPHGLVNSQTDSEIVFRGGNLIDIQLAANPDADPERTEPASGDLRLLVSRRDGEPLGVLFRPRIEGFEDERTVLSSPTGQEPFDDISEVDIGIEYDEHSGGFEAKVTVPLDVLGLELSPGMDLRMDLGYIFGDSQGRSAQRRVYINNNSFSANIVDDIPNESRLEPHEWGLGIVE